MDKPFLYYKEILEPTSVINSVFITPPLWNNKSSKWIPFGGNDLLITTTSQSLNIYKVCTASTTISSSSSSIPKDNNTYNLIKMKGLQLYGSPRDVCKIIRRNMNQSNLLEDHLLIAFDDGKLVLLSFNIETFDFDACSYYNAEEDAIGLGADIRGSGLKRINNSIDIIVDDESELACMNIHGSELFFLNYCTTNNIRPFVISISKDLEVTGKVLDYCFISGGNQPAIAILYEIGTLPLGHVKENPNNCSVALFAIDLIQQKLIKLWTKEKLPYNSFKLMPLKHSAFQGGMLLITMNGIILFNRDYISVIGTNAFFYISPQITNQCELESNTIQDAIEFDNSSWLEISEFLYIASLKNGKILLLHLNIGDALHWSKTKIAISYLGVGVKSTSISKNTSCTLCFFGGGTSYSVLFAMKCNSNHSHSIKNIIKDENVSSKRKKLETGIDASSESLLMYNNSKIIETKANYNDSGNSSQNQPENNEMELLELHILDYLPVFGPIYDGSFIVGTRARGTITELSWSKGSLLTEGIENKFNNSSSAAAFIHESEAKDVLMLSAGVGKDSSMYCLSQGIRITKVAARPFPLALSMVTLNITLLDMNCIILNYNDKIRIMKASMLKNKLHVEEISPDSVILENEPTLEIHVFEDKSNTKDVYFVQITRKSIRLVNVSLKNLKFKLIDEVTLEKLGEHEDDAKIVSQDVLHDRIALRCKSNTCYILQKTDKKLECTYVISNQDNTKVKEKEKQVNHEFKREIISISWFYGILSFGDKSNQTNSRKSNCGKHNIFDAAIESKYMYGEEDNLDSTNDQSNSSKGGDEEEIAPKRQKAKATGKRSKKSAAIPESSSSLPSNDDDNRESISDPKMYMVLCDTGGHCIVYEAETCTPQCHIGIQLKEKLYISSSNFTTSDDDLSNEFIVKDMRIHRLEETNINTNKSVLCLSVVTNRGDLLVFTGDDHIHDQLRVLSLHNRKCLNRKNKELRTQRYRQRHALSFMYDVARNAVTKNFLDNHFHRVTLEGKEGLRVNGSFPHVVMADRGYPVMTPFHFPELPHGNVGEMCICDLNLGNTSFYISLWREDTLADAPGRTAFLGVYQKERLGEFSNGGNVSLSKVRVGMTVHQFKDIMPLSDDRIEQSMLEKERTVLLVSSQENHLPFIETVLTEKECEDDRANYDRFYPDMTSFCQPNPSKAAIPSTIEMKFSLNIVYGDSVVDTVEIPNGEHIMDIDVAYLDIVDELQTTVTHKKKVFIIVATGISDKHGEDSQGEGRLLLYGIDYSQLAKSTMTSVKSGVESAANEVEVDQGQGTLNSPTPSFLDVIRPKLRLLWAGPGPASIVRQFGNYVLSTVGALVYIYKLIGDSELEQISFFHSKFFISTVSIVKDFILLGDAYSSVQFLVWRELDNSLTLLGCDYDKSHAMAISFIIDDTSLGMVVADGEQNIRLLQYNPLSLESKQGYRLINLADFHLGSVVSLLLPHASVGGSNGATYNSGTRFDRLQRVSKSCMSRTGSIIGSYDGGVGMLLPIDEKVYRRLALLQQIMGTVIPARFGLNSRDFRKLKCLYPKVSAKRSILDGKLLSNYLVLDESIQDDIATAMGTTAETVLENLLEIDILLSYF